MKKVVTDFNDYLGGRLAKFLSSMGCFWIIFALVVLPLFKDHPHDLISWIVYVVQTIFQGAALPVLGYVADKGSEAVMVLIRQIHMALTTDLQGAVHRIEAKVDEELAIVKADLAVASEERDLLRQLVQEIHQNVTIGVGGENDVNGTSDSSGERVSSKNGNP